MYTLANFRRKDTSLLSPQIQRLEITCDQLRVDLKAEIQSAQDSLLAKLDEQSSSLKAIERRQIHQKKAENVEDRRTYYASLQNVPIQINHFVQSVGKVAKYHRVLRTLLVTGLGSREEQIHDAYEKPFGWIYQDEELRVAREDRERIKAARTRFERWLSSSSEVFWVNGKAGSGKSTLMKYLADHPKTREILRHWAGDENLVVAKHFFWNSGTKIQKSHVGLMQNLLLQILRQCPELIPFASAERWEADEGSLIHEDDWTRTELAAALKNIMLRGQLRSRFCFFIDGLDEYADENAGEHHELIEYLDTLAHSTQVKLCVSSRPWTVFKDRYEGKKDLTLVLQDLTSNDMYRYVHGILNNDARFRRLVAREPQALDLAHQIRDKAEGVFLWVYLVVRSLLKGLSERDVTAELERRLSKIPNDLNEYFLKIFQNIDPVYRPEASRAFQLSAVVMPLPLPAFKHIPKEVMSSRYAFEMTPAELKVSDDKAKDNVNKWCRDLLEIKTTRDNVGGKIDEVCFLHRTVKDFLLTREMQAYLNQHPACQSSPKQAICMVLFAEIKAMGVCQSMDEYRAFDDHAKKLMEWALDCERTESETPTQVLDEFGRIRSLVIGDWQGWSHSDYTPSVMLHYAIETGLRLYVRQCLDGDPKAEHDTLWFVSPLNTHASHHITAEDKLAFFTLLLEKGADPNQHCPSGHKRGPTPSRKTIWETSLVSSYNEDVDGAERCVRNKGLRLFAKPWIHFGANINIKVVIGPRRIDFRTCLLSKRGHWPGMTRSECEREVDDWLADAPARRAPEILGKPSEPSKRPSLRAKLRRLLA